MRRIVLVIALLFRSVAAQAQEAGSPEALNAARELLAVISPDMIGQLMQGMTAQIWPQIESGFGARGIDQATSSELRAEFEQTLQQFMADWMKDAAGVYARYFSAQELHEMAGFYQTPTGAKTLQLMPKVMAELFSAMAPSMASYQQALQARMQAILQKHGYPR
jgi:hypothetical protein